MFPLFLKFSPPCSPSAAYLTSRFLFSSSPTKNPVDRKIWTSFFAYLAPLFIWSFSPFSPFSPFSRSFFARCVVPTSPLAVAVLFFSAALLLASFVSPLVLPCSSSSLDCALPPPPPLLSAPCPAHSSSRGSGLSQTGSSAGSDASPSCTPSHHAVPGVVFHCPLCPV